MLGVPIIQQISPSSCGSACLYACLRYWQPRVALNRESDLWVALDYDEECGVEPDDIAAIARKHGLVAAHRRDSTVGDIVSACATGATVIVLLQAHRDDPHRAWSECWEDGHYVVLVGTRGDRAYFMDPSTHDGYVWLDFDDLVDRWHCHGVDGEHEYGVCVVVRGDHSQRLDRYPAEPRPLG